MAKKQTSQKRPAGQTTERAGAAPKRSGSAIEGELRKLDREILKVVSRRAALTIKMIQQNPHPHRAIFDPQGDIALYAELEKSNPGPLGVPSVKGIFREMVNGARNLVKVRRVAYLGPAYTFSHQAAIERFGTSGDFLPVSTIAAVFEEVNRGHAEFGIVPLENSTDGRIVDTLDMFTRLPLKICAEVQLNIHHNLLARCPRSEVVEVYSKPQALSQCREWLDRNMPQAKLIEVTSTATAAQLARDKHGAAAVASRQAGVQYDLQVIADNIEDNRHNITRFAVIGDEGTRTTGDDKTSLLLQIADKPGALADALVCFKKHKINLSWIESFPIKGPEPGYLFFIDLEGHLSEARTKRTLEELEPKAVRMEVLGSYPRTVPV